jgi:hypothetical protein
MTVNCRIIDLANSSVKFIIYPAAIDVMLSSRSRGYLYKSNKRESPQIAAYVLLGFFESKFCEEILVLNRKCANDSIKLCNYLSGSFCFQD